MKAGTERSEACARGKAVWQDTRSRGRGRRGGQEPGDGGSGGAGCRVPVHSKVMGSQGEVSRWLWLKVDGTGSRRLALIQARNDSAVRCGYRTVGRGCNENKTDRLGAPSGSPVEVLSSRHV